MEDGEGYMVLNCRLKAGNAVPGCRNSTKTDTSARSRKDKVLLGILGAGFVLAGLAAVLLSVFIFLGGFHRRETPEALNGTKDGRLGCRRGGCLCSKETGRLKDLLCGDPTESSECKLCPAGWIPRKGKCYWFSPRTSKWQQAQDYCSNRRGRLVVIKDSEEKDFIQRNIRGEYRIWIGLHLSYPQKTWTWVDGSSFNRSLFTAFFIEDGNSCGVIQNGRVRPEMCADEFKWICEMEGLRI